MKNRIANVIYTIIILTMVMACEEESGPTEGDEIRTSPYFSDDTIILFYYQ